MFSCIAVWILRSVGMILLSEYMAFTILRRAPKSKDHWRFGPYTLIFLIPRTLLFSFCCDACSISAIGEFDGKSQLAKYFQNFLRTPEIWRVERGGGLKFHDNEVFSVLFLDFLVGVVIYIEHIICRLLTNHDNWWNCFKNKICYVMKWFLGDNLEVTCTFLTTCTVNNTKLKARQRNIYILRNESVSFSIGKYSWF